MNRVRPHNMFRFVFRSWAGYGILLFLSANPITAAATQAPDVVIREVFHELLSQLDIKRQEDALTHDIVREIFATLLNPRIDYLSLARWILRDHWVNASEGQQTEFLHAFELYIINTYALALSNGKRIALEVEDNPLLRKNTAVVTAGIKFADADAIPLDFRLIQRNEKWLLFDVTFSGVSLARTFRSDFNYVARDGGIDAVTTHLNRRREGFTP